MPVVTPGESSRRFGTAGYVLATLGWIAFATCATLFLLFYVTDLRADGKSGRVGVVVNPQAPQAQWRYAPAAGVEVVVSWPGRRVSGFFQSGGYCARTRVVRTDRDGNFSADGWWETPGWPPPRIDPASAYPLASTAADEPADFTVILGPTPEDWAIAAMLVEKMTAAQIVAQSGCPPSRQT